MTTSARQTDPHVGAAAEARQETIGPETAPRPGLSPAARRALAEAEARRAAIDARAAAIAAVPEHHGRGGAEPVRYADWEVAGRAVDF